MKRGHVSYRTCRGCGRKDVKGALIRLVVHQGILVEDANQGMAGRGVYCCTNERCRTRLEKNTKILKRMFCLQVG